MTDDDKALVKRLRKEDEWTNQKPYFHAHPKCLKAADRIEALSAEIARLRREKAVVDDLLEQQQGLALQYLVDCNKAVVEIEAQAAEIARLIAAGDELNVFAMHDNACHAWSSGDPVDCNCGYTAAWKAWRDVSGGNNDR